MKLSAQRRMKAANKIFCRLVDKRDEVDPNANIELYTALTRAIHQQCDYLEYKL